MNEPKPCDKPRDGYTASPYADLYPEPEDRGPGRVFWMVWVEGRGGPVTRHYDEAEAADEACRLARKEAPRRVYRLRSEGYCQIEERPVGWHDCEA